VIRQAQFDALVESKWREFVRYAREHCRQAHPEICQLLGEDGVAAKVESGLRQARSFGFYNGDDLCRYLDLLFIEGDQLLAQPWAVQILGFADYAPSTRLDLLERTARRVRNGLPVALPFLDEEEEVPNTSEEEMTAEEEEDIETLPDASWPEPAEAPVPPPVVMQPPDASCSTPPADAEPGRDY